jgi:hypothetical protein
MASFTESLLVRPQFDSYRQNVWNQYVAIHDPIALSISNGSITYEQLSLAISRLTNLITTYHNQYMSVRDQAGRDWIDSRYNDYAIPMQQTLSSWNARLSSTPSVTVPALQTPISQLPLPSITNGLPLTLPVGSTFVSPSGGQAYAPEWMQGSENGESVAEPTKVNWLPWIIGGGLLFLMLRR